MFSHFGRTKKPEQHQFFGSTCERFPYTNKKPKNTKIGPGTYNPGTLVLKEQQLPQPSAAFMSERKDLLFSGNEYPSPQQYKCCLLYTSPSPRDS